MALTRIQTAALQSSITGSNITDGSILAADLITTSDFTFYGVKVGRGGGAVASNTAVGASALAANTTGSRNTAFGGTAGAALTTGARNTLLGNNILSTATTSSDNVMIGDYVGRGYTGSNSVAIGAQALSNASANTGDNLIAIGQGALNANASGANNTAIGQAALTSNTTASNNTAVGYQAGTSNTTGTGITAIGYSTLSFNTTGAYNVAVGGVGGASGYTTLNVNTSGSYNTGIGMGALGQNTTASNNTAVGYQAGYTNQTGASNTFVGHTAGYTSNYNGNAYNTALGERAGYSLTTGTINTFVGSGAGYYISSGDKNTILGRYSGNQGGVDIRTLGNNIVLSDGDGNPRLYYNYNSNPGGWQTQAGFYTYGARQLSVTSSTNYDLLTAIPAGTWLCHIQFAGATHGGFVYIVRTYDVSDRSVTLVGGGGMTAPTVSIPTTAFNSATIRFSSVANHDAVNITLMPLA